MTDNAGSWPGPKKASSDHDPFCTRSEVPYAPWRPCYCDVIARVRADERKRAEERVETLRNHPGLITISAAAALAAGDTWTSQW